jgi:hypothetical protein
MRVGDGMWTVARSGTLEKSLNLVDGDLGTCTRLRGRSATHTRSGKTPLSLNWLELHAKNINASGELANAPKL